MAKATLTRKPNLERTNMPKDKTTLMVAIVTIASIAFFWTLLLTGVYCLCTRPSL